MAVSPMFCAGGTNTHYMHSQLLWCYSSTQAYLRTHMHMKLHTTTACCARYRRG
eukprot:m.1663773 g.1663773  ORF g.1663773 m.1663773 type:complete len:54 (+) comp137460_c0_seq1:14-175(+)